MQMWSGRSASQSTALGFNRQDIMPCMPRPEDLVRYIRAIDTVRGGRQRRTDKCGQVANLISQSQFKPGWLVSRMPVKQGMRLICSLEFDEETRFFPPERKPKENPRRLSDPNVNSRGLKKIRSQAQTGNSVAACRSDAAWPASDELYNEPGVYAVSGEGEGRRQGWRQRVQQQEQNRAKK